MKKPPFLFIFFIFVNNVYSDEPPDWGEFTIHSENHNFKADIEYSKGDSLKKPWDRTWKIRVYALKPETSIIWEQDFFHDGYGDGILSNDGKAYVYVDYWLRMKSDQVEIYLQDSILRLSGEDLTLVPSNYQHTVSHQIWVENYYLVPNQITDSTKLIFETLDSKRLELSLKDLSIKSSILHPEFIQQNKTLKKYGIGVLFFLAIGIILILVKKNRA